ncbi:hypothetical protein, partial [Halomonas marinisediminis]
LTLGQPILENADRIAARDLAVARALAQGSAHPLARAIAATDAGGASAEVTELREVPGYGVEGRWQDQPVRLGRADWVGATQGDVTATWLRIGQAAPVAFEFKDALR